MTHTQAHTEESTQTNNCFRQLKCETKKEQINKQRRASSDRQEEEEGEGGRDRGGSTLTGTTFTIAGARGYQLWKDKTGQSQQHTHIQKHTNT